jgi:phosphatidate cytidylyltransferase
MPSREMIRETATWVVLVAILFAPASAVFAAMLCLVGVGTFELLRVTRHEDLAVQAAGVSLALGHSATLWLFEHNARVLVPAQALLPVSAVFITLWRPGDVRTLALRLTAIAFGPLWVGLLTYLALVRRMEPSGCGYAVMALSFAGLASVGSSFGSRAVRGSGAASPLVARGLPFVGAVVATIPGGLLASVVYLRSLPVVHALGLAVVAAVLAHASRWARGALSRSTEVDSGGGAVSVTPGPVLLQLDTLFFPSALVYGYLRAILS